MLSRAPLIKCVDILEPVLGAFNAKIFACKVEVMMEGIIQAFKDRVSGVGWIDKQTVQAVREKVRNS